MPSEQSPARPDDDLLTDDQASVIIETLLSIQRQAIQERNTDLWLQSMYIPDSIAAQMQKLWFEGYACQIIPCSVNIELLATTTHLDHIISQVCYTFAYDAYETIQEIYTQTITFVPEYNEWRITWLTKTPEPFPADTRPIHPRRAQLLPLSPPNDSAWWEQSELLHLVQKATDPLSPSLYAQSISRTVRARERFPELESASILADMISLRGVQLALQLADPNPVQVLVNLHAFAQDSVRVQVPRPDRNNSWNSKLTTPWFGLDEIVAASQQPGMLMGSCPSIMSLYVALLRLNGFNTQSVFQLRLHNHDVVIVSTQNTWYLIDPGRTTVLTPRTLYYTRQIYKIFNDALYWTQFGVTNQEERAHSDFFHVLQETLPSFHFVCSSPATVNAPTPQDASLTIDLAKLLATYPDIDAERVHFLALRQLLAFSASYPASPLTWAKYAYQSVLVPLPQVYAAWSLQAPILRHALTPFARLSDLLATLAQFPLHSIFPEADRLMTADQVLRHRCADPPARALLLFAYLRLLSLAPSACVLLTTHAAYCLAASPAAEGASCLPLFPGWSLWDAGSLSLVSAPRGSLLLAFDDRSAFSLLLGQEPSWQQPPAWYPMILDAFVPVEPQ